MSAGDEPSTGDRAHRLETNDTDLYEQAPCAYLSTLHDGTIIRGNQTFFEWIGARAEDIVGTTRFQTLLTVGSRIYYETHYAPLLQMQGFVSEIALDVRRTDGTVRPIVASARQLRGSGVVPTINRVALFDSTDRRRYEQELLQARRHAEEGASALAQADAQKNEFIAMLAHELRNPLAPMRNALDLMRRAGNEEKIVSKATDVMHRQVAQMVRLVEDLFDISRVGQDKLSIRRVPVDLASVIHHAVEAGAPLLDNAGLSYTVTLPDAPIYVEADAARLAQVIGNILNNASKFTPHGGSVALVLERDGDEAVVRIRDTGMGIDASDLPRVFEMFVQTDAPLESRSGLGIGLTLARHLVERHEGRLTVQSEGRGRGTEAIVRLPALAAPPESVARSGGTSSRPGLKPESKRVLVVDDNHDSANMMAMLLEFVGHDVRTTHDGVGAVVAVAEFQPHVVLLDIGLPGLNGYEVGERIRRAPGVQPVLVAITGWGQADDRRRSAEAGFDHHLVKPVDHDVLIQVVADAPAHVPH
jgi:signal transduction histidine kinase/CheY-like chemotaxis protein